MNKTIAKNGDVGYLERFRFYLPHGQGKKSRAEMQSWRKVFVTNGNASLEIPPLEGFVRHHRESIK
ncbi:MAG: hypothetical protein NTW91_11080 [Verrucomicrobia bacterium]|nr:hypothetical protein [Verrucomicrobiota bacterium]